MSRSQSFIRPGQRPGGQSGSHIANDEVRKILRGSLRRADKAAEKTADAHFRSKPGDLAKYLEVFENTKRSRDFNYLEMIRQKQELRLSLNNGCQLRIDLDHNQIENIFDTAHKRGLDLLETEVIGSAGNDTAILFTGGSYLSAGLRSEVAQKMDKICQNATHRGSIVKYDFLGNHGALWSTAVSAGAVMGAVTMPSLQGLLEGFTLGLQVNRRHTPFGGKSHWQKGESARVLFSQGVGSYVMNHDIPMRAVSSGRLRFRLVCDPTYTKDREAGELSGTDVPPIQIQKPRQVPGPGPYDIGCEIEPRDIPTGNVRFALGGPCLQHLAAGRFSEAIVADYLPLELRCFKVDDLGQFQDHFANKRFLLQIKADLASRFPIVANEDDFRQFAVPFSCHYCPESVSLMCRTSACKISLCSACAEGHAKDHDLDPVPRGFE